MNQLKTARPLIIMLLFSVFTIPISLFLNWNKKGAQIFYSTIRSHFFFCF